MSFLTPLYILGALTVAGPIVFHLIRRTTKGEVPFSSLIFLSPSPPRLTRRHRLEHWFLLLLRATALCLLAVAFARPFLRQASGMSLGETEQRRVALLIDTSASMRRGDLWAKAKTRVDEAIDAIGPGDQLAVFAFDAAWRNVLRFDESATLDPARRHAVARALVERITPSWGATHLGQALIDTAGAIEHVGDDARKSATFRRRIVLISDLQQGSRLDVLEGFEWPSDVELDLKTVATEGTNAGLQWLAGPDVGEPSAALGANNLRVRVSNDATSKKESFGLAWTDDKAPPIPAYVPPGESRVVRVPRPTGATRGRSLRLQGDTQEFDNVLYLASEAKESAAVLYIGRDAPDDPSGLCYYLNRVFEDTPRRAVKVESRSPTSPLAIEPGRSVPLIVLAAETSAGNVALLKQFAEDGGTLLTVVTAAGKAPTLSALADVPAVEVQDSPARGDAMLSEIAFDHPLFSPFAAPQFNDFTKIRFWRYRLIPTASLGDVRVLARFEKGDPAVIEKALGKGRLLILASGWSPADSQLARSSKFMPLMSALLDGPNAGPDLSANWLVQEHVPLPEGAVAVRKPDGSTTTLAPGASAFSETDAPGIYAVETAKGAREFAVNLDPLESKTAPLDLETLEQFGCRLALSAPRIENEREAMRQLQNAELEGRQKLWRPLILTAISILIVETWLAGWLGRPRPNLREAPAS
jgi:Aerotolerance regulator N-terminal/von Willebrand factor type A domain